MKSAEEIMNILEAYGLMGSLRDAAELAGCSQHTVARYVAERERGRAVPAGAQRESPVIGAFLPKLEELVERSKGKIRAEVAHEKITAMGYAGPSGPPDCAGSRQQRLTAARASYYALAVEGFIACKQSHRSAVI